MLQRIQSIWLFLASISGLSGFKLPFYSGTDANGIPSSTLEATDGLNLTIPTIVVGVITLITIFLFRNRSMQLKLSIAALLTQLLLIYFYFKDASNYSGGNFALTAALQFFVVVFLILAMMGINRDNKIIRESNRLR